MIRFDQNARRAFIIACVTLAVSWVGFRSSMAYLQIYLRKEAIEVREHFTSIPRVLGAWRAVGEDAVLVAEVVEELGTAVYLDRTYAINGNLGQGSVNLHIAYYTGMIDAIPHVPDRCFNAGGFEATAPTYTVDDLSLDTSHWRYDPEVVNRSRREPYPYVIHVDPITGRAATVRMPLGRLGLRVTPFRHPSQPGLRIHAGFFFIANGQATPSPYAVRALAFDRTDRYAYYCKVQFTSMGGPEFGEAEFVERVTDLLQNLLPEIMRCLPDWAEVEAQLPPARADGRTS